MTRRAVCFVYLAKNMVNGKVYVGKSSSNLRAVQRRHRLNADKNSPLLFSKAIRKYGMCCFEWRILLDGLDEAESFEWEKILIRKHNSYGDGYNMTPGGDGHTGPKFCMRGKARSDESKKKQSDAMTGRILSIEHRRAISLGNTRPFLGKKHTEETKEKIRAARKLQAAMSEETRMKISAAIKGKTYEEMYGPEKAAELRAVRSASLKGKSKTESHRLHLSEALSGKKRGKRGRYKCKLSDHAVVDMRRDGYTLDFIAKRAGVSRSCIQFILREMDHK